MVTRQYCAGEGIDAKAKAEKRKRCCSDKAQAQISREQARMWLSRDDVHASPCPFVASRDQTQSQCKESAVNVAFPVSELDVFIDQSNCLDPVVRPIYPCCHGDVLCPSFHAG
jgi:hypothetical protein